MQKQKLKRGFTLIELIVVIAIVGILAAVAMPRLIAAQRDARIAKMQAVYGSLRSAATLARGRCELDRSTGGNNNYCYSKVNEEGYVVMDGEEIAMINNFPRADTGTKTKVNGSNPERFGKGILAASQIELSNDGFKAEFSDANNGNNRVLELTLNGAGTPDECKITYKEAIQDPNNANNFLAPTFHLNVDGC